MVQQYRAILLSSLQFDTAAVHIMVLDVNDNSPQLNSSAPSVFLIVEGQPDIFVGQISVRMSKLSSIFLTWQF